jgi:hypothetical protein
VKFNRSFPRLKSKPWITVVLFFAALVAGVAAMAIVTNVLRFMAVDRCLDAGGSYDHQSDQCVFGN